MGLVKIGDQHFDYMKTLGYIFVAVIIFLVGYAFGATPSEQEEFAQQKQTQVASDIALVGDKYSYLYNLCEQKYQLALDGDYYEAIRLNGQMDSLLIEINKVLTKYNDL